MKRPHVALLLALSGLTTACGTWLPTQPATPNIASSAPLPAELPGASGEWPGDYKR